MLFYYYNNMLWVSFLNRTTKQQLYWLFHNSIIGQKVLSDPTKHKEKKNHLQYIILLMLSNPLTFNSDIKENSFANVSL